MARLAMADLAEKTLDGRYYIWDADITGLILADRLLRTADRGVHVRLLIDDNYMTGARDFKIAAFDVYPSIEIRFFNSVRNRGRRIMSFLAEFGRVKHGMHNKLFVMDNAVGIVGGRNIADIYFGVRTDYNYRDLDVVTAGPIVNEVSGSDERIADLRARLAQVRDGFVWAPGRVLVERPSKVSDNTESVIATALGQRTSEVEHELLVESPYFVLGDPTIEKIRQLKARGVKVRVLTNSAASNDVLAAHAGYANTREPLLEAGVDLYELRPDSNMKRDWSLLAGKSRAA